MQHSMQFCFLKLSIAKFTLAEPDLTEMIFEWSEFTVSGLEGKNSNNTHFEERRGQGKEKKQYASEKNTTIYDEVSFQWRGEQFEEEKSADVRSSKEVTVSCTSSEHEGKTKEPQFVTVEDLTEERDRGKWKKRVAKSKKTQSVTVEDLTEENDRGKGKKLAAKSRNTTTYDDVSFDWRGEQFEEAESVDVRSSVSIQGMLPRSKAEV
jgi:hypothetical protein